MIKKNQEGTVDNHCISSQHSTKKKKKALVLKSHRSG